MSDRDDLDDADDLADADDLIVAGAMADAVLEDDDAPGGSAPVPTYEGPVCTGPYPGEAGRSGSGQPAFRPGGGKPRGCVMNCGGCGCLSVVLALGVLWLLGALFRLLFR